jgi:Family of unknown function (DUF6527)
MATIQLILLRLLVWIGVVPSPDLVVRLVADHPAPASVKLGCIYAVGVQGHQKWVYFRCPADQHEIIQLSLMSNRRPNWELRLDWLGRPTLHPSVRQLDGSLAHFWVKNGRIEWCSDSGKRFIRPGLAR